MEITVDANETRSGLVELLESTWDYVKVRRLPAGDIAIGQRVLIERKTGDDLVASLADGRLFRQARQLVNRSDRPVLVLEGDVANLADHNDRGARRGALLALAVGFRIPVLNTSDVGHTAQVVRHIAAQEARRESQRRRERQAHQHETAERGAHKWAPEAIEVLATFPGVGRSRARLLARHTQSLSEVAQLGMRELLAIPGIGPDTAARIFDVLRGAPEDRSNEHAERPPTRPRR